MSAGAARKTLAQLHRQAWHEIPEVMASSCVMVVGLGICGAALWMYSKFDGDNKRYRYHYTVYRPDDPRVKSIRE